MSHKLINQFCTLTLLVFISSFSHSVSAHTRSVSYSNWLINNDQIIMTFIAPAREVTKLNEYQLLYPDLAASLEKHLVNSIHLNPSSKLINNKALLTEQGTVGIELIYTIDKKNIPLRIEMNAFYDVTSSHTHYATINTREGLNKSIIVNEQNRSFEILSLDEKSKDQTIKEVIFGYIDLGFTHILSGFDHLVFLLLLLLLCSSLKELFFTATGFTVGHSLTLFLAASNLVIPNTKIIESLIGLTIVITAIEAINLPIIDKKRMWLGSIFLFIFLLLISVSTSIIDNSLFIIGIGLLTISYLKLIQDQDTASRYRPLLACIFGTIHGFGFANILNEMGIVKTNYLQALFGFNIGVELGQILVLTVLWLSYTYIKKHTKNKYFFEIRSLISSILLSIGLYWLITRLFI